MNSKHRIAAMVADELAQAFAEFLVTQIGLHYPRKRWPDLVRGMDSVAHGSGFAGAEACMRSLLGTTLTRGQVEMLAAHLSVGETYFFRDPDLFCALEQELLPGMIAARRVTGKQLRIWSAGCCTGEEAYSVAALISRLIPDRADWSIHILGTDINSAFLKKAEHGIYRDWSFRGVPAWVRQRHFDTQPDGSQAIRPDLRRMVRFAHLNLASDLYPAPDNNTQAMDIIFCRNVLMYFDTERIDQVVQRLHRALVPGGYLIVSASEVGQRLFPGFAAVRFPGATVYRKSADASAAALQAPVWTGFTPDTAEPAGLVPLTTARIATVAPDRIAADAAAGSETAPPKVAADSTSRAQRARQLANLGQLDDAAQCCRAAIDIDKVNPGLRYLHAMILEEQGQINAAATALRHALYLEPDFILAHFSLASLCRRQNKATSATRHYAIALDLLHACPAAQDLPESDGMSAARLIDIILAQQEPA